MEEALTTANEIALHIWKMENRQYESGFYIGLLGEALP
jgi:hypothetical protein